MKNYELSYNNEEEILNLIKKIILDKHPIVSDRTKILYPDYNEPQTPEMQITFSFIKIDEKDITQVSFMDGTHNYKKGLQEYILINGFISKKVICNLINYLLIDHDYFENIYRHNTSFELSMNVNGCDDNMHGISCGKINLEFDYYNHPDNKRLLSEYFKIIATTFYEQLKETNMFQKEFSNYCNLVKEEFIKSLTDEELKSFIDLLGNDDLYNLIRSIPNNRFIELYNQYNNQEDIKKLIK